MSLKVITDDERRNATGTLTRCATRTPVGRTETAIPTQIAQPATSGEKLPGWLGVLL